MRTAWSRTGNALVLMTVVALVGCETHLRAVEGGGSADPALVAALQERTDWSVRGSLGISTDPGSSVPRQNINASVFWAQNHNNDLEVVLRGPLGIGEIVLQGSNQGASLRRGNSTATGRDPSLLVQQSLGLAVPVPLDELSSWMRGLPGTATELTYDTMGRLLSLVYTDATDVTWRARILRYTRSDALQVPSLITAEGGPYNVRLVLKEWKLVPADPIDYPVENIPKGRLIIPGRSS